MIEAERTKTGSRQSDTQGPIRAAGSGQHQTDASLSLLTPKARRERKEKIKSKIMIFFFNIYSRTSGSDFCPSLLSRLRAPGSEFTNLHRNKAFEKSQTQRKIMEPKQEREREHF